MQEYIPTEQKLQSNLDINTQQNHKERKGIHIIADFFLCQNPDGIVIMQDIDKLESFCLNVITASQLTIVGKLFYQFDKTGITGAILLAESHFTIHTWPEKQYLTLDIFVCNVTKDNTQKALSVYNSLYEKFKPQKINKQEITRE